MRLSLLNAYVVTSILAGLPCMPANAEDAPFQPAPISVPKGFELELAAAPPLVQHPIMAGFDDRGRLYVAENAGLNLKADELLKQLPNSIRRLEDTDGDGQFDKFTVFADKMSFPQGALWHRGALYVASPPHIWRLEDTDDDGVADRREAIVGKFGFTGNAADIHGCFLGPDGRIYWCDGRHGHDFEERDGQPARKGLAARVFSCKLDGSDIEIFCGGGMDNPVEVVFTEEGEMLGTMTFYNPDKDRHDAVVHFAYGGVYPKQHPCTAEFKRTGELMPAVSLFGVVAPSGLTRNRVTYLGNRYVNNLFTTQFNTHKVINQRLIRDGATYRTVDEEFLVSPSIDFHPTDVLEDADGSLLVVDTGGWFRIGCPTSQVAKPDVLGAIYRVRRSMLPRKADPRGLQFDWQQASGVDLRRRLEDSRPAVRDRALDLLAQRNDPAMIVDALAMQIPATARRDLLLACCRSGSPAAREQIVRWLKDKDPSVMHTAAYSAGRLREKAAVGNLLTLTTHTHPPLQREAATALGRIGDSAAVPALLNLLRTGGDRFVEHAAIYALIEINDRSATIAGLADATPQVRRAALIALDQMNDGRLTRELVVPLLDTSDIALQKAALEVISSRSGWGDEIVGLLSTWLRDQELPAERAVMIRGTLLAFRADAKIQTLLAETLARSETTTPIRLLLLETIARSELEPLPGAWLEQLSRHLETTDPEVLRETVSAVTSVGKREFHDRLISLSRTATLPVTLRVSALAAACKQGGQVDESAFDLLLGQLTEQTLPLDRLSACSALGAARLDTPQLARLAESISRCGPLELPLLIGAFEKTQDAHVGLKLVTALEKSTGLSSLPVDKLAGLLAKYPPEVQSAAAPLLVKLESAAAGQREQLAMLEAQLDGGDAARGKEIFFGKKTACTACHRVAGQGEALGPDLSKIGEVRTRRDLLEAIVLPSQSFARGYESYTITTAAGLIHTGIVGRETAECIYLRTPQRAEIRIERRAIEEMAPSRISIMPQGLEKTIDIAELRDLVAYLVSLK